MIAKYLLCRPQGGLNDMLCQIERCCRYAERVARIVVVDTAYAGAEHFRDHLGRYFDARESRLLLSLNAVTEDLEGLEVFPPCLSGQLNAYRVDRKIPLKPYVESASHSPVTFDFTIDYPQRLLVHHQLGGGRLSLFALLRFRLKDVLKRELENRLRAIGGQYSAVHIRHTDYVSDYAATIESLKRDAPERLFVATDNQQVLEQVRMELPQSRIYSFAEALSTDGEPIHMHRGSEDPALIFGRNRDAILDLLMAALSRKLYTCKVLAWRGSDWAPEYSGFSLLAQDLMQARVVLKLLLHPTPIRIGLN